jgi:hypothetical protein
MKYLLIAIGVVALWLFFGGKSGCGCKKKVMPEKTGDMNMSLSGGMSSAVGDGLTQEISNIGGQCLNRVSCA